MNIEEKIKELQTDSAVLWQWVSDLANLVQCLVEDRLAEEDLSDAEKESYRELLKKI